MPFAALVPPAALAGAAVGWAGVPVEADAGRVAAALRGAVAAALGADDLDRLADCAFGRRSGDRDRHERAISGPAV